MILFRSVSEFEWDTGNIGKNLKHKVKDHEAEEVFFDEKKVVLKDILHSGKEERFALLGKTKGERSLFVVFTVRGKKIRVISARDLNKTEKNLYERAT